MTTTPELLAMLRHHYIAESTDPHARAGGVFADEVSPNGSWGGPGIRRADAIYAGFTSASGRILVGHELKVSRADWRAELAKVGKADAWADACHQWWIVAPSTDIVPPEELPEGWGLLLPPRSSRGRRMQVAVKATVKPDHNPPWWAVRSVMARLETLEHDQRRQEIQRVVQAQVEERMKHSERYRRPDPVSHEDRVRLSTLDSLERELGFKIHDWRSKVEDQQISASDLKRALHIAGTTHGPVRTLEHTDRLLADVQRAAAELAEAIPAALALAGAKPEGATR
ncbi:hypothetical protein [Brachybacterium sp.]|uniref:hypothetical protein n=1 Tax=Brachybacterium sp. TaxID=1891286 RepID=UPI002ED2734B